MKRKFKPIETGKDLIESYQVILELASKDLLAQFNKRLKKNPGSAYCEAIVFSLLENQFKFKPTINEDPSNGGPDFKGTHRLASEIFVEVKYLDKKTVTRKSLLSDKLEETSAGYCRSITPRIRGELSDAAKQLADCNGPRICVIGSDHLHAQSLFDEFAASTLLTSESRIEIPIGPEGGAVGDAKLVTGLEDAAFAEAKPDKNGKLHALRQSISAVILMAFNFELAWARLIGVLHHEPAVPLDIKLFPGIPFGRLKEPPKLGGSCDVEFVIHDPSPLDTRIFKTLDLQRHLRTDEHETPAW